MGKADIAVKNWLSDRERFADLFNGTVFGGRQVVLPEELEDMDRETDIIITDKEQKERGVQRFRDLVKLWNRDIFLVVLACEIQDKKHYAMPVRNMLQDSLSYMDQIRGLWRRRRSGKVQGQRAEDSEKEAVKANVLKILKEKYDFEEEDFLSAEIEVVPSGKARDYGIDRSMVAGYGHDDRVCAYTSLMALLQVNDPEYTSCCILVDKEEIGSVGATGAQSLFFENTVAELLAKQGTDSFVKTRQALANSKMLSSDVSAGVDPLYLSVNDKKNAAYLGKGIVFNKYTGSRGKSGSNDANAEYMAEIRNVLDSKNVYYQTAELGKVDQGGGGTIAYILGNYNMNVIDAGVAVLNMHAPMEIVSKVDVYEAYVAYLTFLENI